MHVQHSECHGACESLHEQTIFFPSEYIRKKGLVHETMNKPAEIKLSGSYVAGRRRGVRHTIKGKIQIFVNFFKARFEI